MVTTKKTKEADFFGFHKLIQANANFYLAYDFCSPLTLFVTDICIGSSVVLLFGKYLQSDSTGFDWAD